MIPKEEFQLEGIKIGEEISSGKTYSLESTGKKIDEREALRQSIHKELMTEQGRYFIYEAYGIATPDLIGKEKDYAYHELCRRIAECLSADERILKVTGFQKEETTQKEALAVSFLVESIYGEIKGKEVFHFAGQ